MASGFIDMPYEDDLNKELLGLKKEITALSKFILECQTPMTIAIQGDWGTGKTSMMKMIQKKIANDCECVWFNTWQFSQFQMQDDVPLALLSQLLETVTGDQNKAMEIISGLFKKVKSVTGIASEAVTAIPGLGKVVDGLFKEDVVAQATQLKKLKEEFKNAITKRLKDISKNRLVIFVDDLDRMNPGKAVELLEVIKLFLDIPGCVFVLAVDYGVVSRGVRAKYGEMDEEKGRSFFDKIIQLPFNLPVAKYTIQKYLKNLLVIPDGHVSAYNRLAKNSVGTNPRTLKRMANILKLLEIIEQEEEPPQELTPEYKELMFAALCMQMAFETIYAQILSDGVKENLLEAKPDRLCAIFSDALERAPGKKEDVQKKLVRFFKTLNEVLSEMGENGWQQFSDVLKKSGITASGSQQPFVSTESINDAFDPALVGNWVKLPQALQDRYTKYFDILKLAPETDEDEPNNLSMPAIFGWSISFGCVLEPEGINIYFWSEENAKIKNCYKSCIKEAGVKFPAELTVKKGAAKAFMTLPAIPWQVPLSRMDKAASEERFKQAAEEVFKWCDALLVPMQKFYGQKVEVVNQIYALIDKIEAEFKKILPEENGWIYTQSDFGCALYPGWCSLALRKADWNEDYEIKLLTDELFANQMNIGVSQTYNEEYEQDKKATAFFNVWKKALSAVPDVDKDEGIDRNDSYCAFVMFPEDIADWTSGNLDEDDFAFALDAEQERKVLEFCEKCAEAIAANEELLDGIAKAE